MFQRRSRILLIYTGGTIGMIENANTGALEAFNFDELMLHVPEVKRFNCHIASYQFYPAIDSSDISPDHWAKLVKVIEYNYDEFDGFVVLHGTDTMAFTASALSFMLENLCKPVILTGSQLPIGKLRTDGKENLITSIEVAMAKRRDNTPMVQEVAVFFESKLMRGNRTTKFSAEEFNAFKTFNYPPLADVGIEIKFHEHLLLTGDPKKPLKTHFKMNPNVVILSLAPGIQENIVRAMLEAPGLRAVVMRTYGSGNAPQKDWLVRLLKEATNKGIAIVNITQCMSGQVLMSRYETGLHLLQAGIMSGRDCTLECAMTKIMFLLAHDRTLAEIQKAMKTSIAGEVTL
ncbi:MAG TPA: type I asparaginase [Bacteroidaceae bacterium]|mgnify:CR=1 FL=1|nr:type I asparaginase [Bacteroidaceae bacterium]